MTRGKKISNVIIALIMIAMAVVLCIMEYGYIYVALFLFAALAAMGIKYLWFYVTMARHMVDGRRILLFGVIMLDVGILLLSLYDDPHIYVILYLVGYRVFRGVVEILGATNEHKYGNPSWKFSVLAGVMNILLAVICLIFINDYSVVTYIYGAGLIVSAIRRIISTFRKTDIVYIP